MEVLLKEPMFVYVYVCIYMYAYEISRPLQPREGFAARIYVCMYVCIYVCVYAMRSELQALGSRDCMLLILRLLVLRGGSAARIYVCVYVCEFVCM